MYKKVYAALENKHLWVVFEANMGERIKGLKKKPGDDYNHNKLGGIKVLVVCNGFYANDVSSVDTKMLALNPQHVTVLRKPGVTEALYARPAIVGKGSPAEPVL